MWTGKWNAAYFRALLSISTGFGILRNGWRLRTKAQGQVQLLLNLTLSLLGVSSNIKKIPAEAIFYLFISGLHELVENVLSFVPSSQFDKLSRVRITLASYCFLEPPAECKIWLSCSLNKAFNVPWDVTVHRNGIQCSACWETEEKLTKLVSSSWVHSDWLEIQSLRLKISSPVTTKVKYLTDGFSLPSAWTSICH